MRLVIDANIIFAAPIRDGAVRKALLDERIDGFVPEFIFHEIARHEGELAVKSGIPRLQIGRFIVWLFDVAGITVVPDAETRPFLEKAKSISPDCEDVEYLALALKLNLPLWSEDKVLRRQNQVPILSASDVLKLIKK